MRVVVTGATGNVGTSLLEVLVRDPAITEIIGVARRRPATWSPPRVTWRAADVGRDPLGQLFRGADAVIHLAWLIQPSRSPRQMWSTNVVGTRRVIDAVAAGRVPTLVAMSSIGAYSPRPPEPHAIDESWPTDGVAESSYSWQKATAERMLDAFEAAAPDCRVVRFRPALIFTRESARHVRELFLGRFVPVRLAPRNSLDALVHRNPFGLQVVHADDVAVAIHRAVTTDVRGAFNLAAPGLVGERRDRAVRYLTAAGQPALGAAWRARLVPIDPGWLALAGAVPHLCTRRAQHDLAWTSASTADEIVDELLGGLRDNASFPTPPLAGSRFAGTV